MHDSWAGLTITALLVLALGWVADWPIVIGAGLLAAILCGSRWIAVARARHDAEQEAADTAPETTDDETAPPSNIIQFRRPDDPSSGG